MNVLLMCGHDTQQANVAPFMDLARLSRTLVADIVSRGGVPPPVIRVHLAETVREARAMIAALCSSRGAAEAVVLPAGEGVIEPAPPEEDLLALLREQHEAGAWIVALGSSVLTVAASGLLLEGPAAIPPRNARFVQRYFPAIRLAHAAPFVEGHHVLTAAEPAFIFSIVVALAQRIYSHGLAEQYRRSCGIPEDVRREGNPLPPRTNHDLLIAEARAWIIAHLHEDIDTEDIAAQFHVSARTLSRRFMFATGVTPARFLRDARIDAARSMLRMTRFSIDQIAHIVGYSDAAVFRSVFRKKCGISPRAFRMARG